MTKNKSKTIALFGTAMLIGTISFAQSIVPQSVNIGGAKMAHANGSLNFSVGELMVLSHTDSQGNTLGSGFIAGATLDQVVLTINDLQGKEVYSGKYVGMSNVIGINITSYATDTYMLSLKNLKHQVFGTYKIIKN